MKACFTLRQPAAELPLLLSVPHCGAEFPPDLVNLFKPGLLPPDDTDWFVDRLYEPAIAMGATMISATYSRWVIDLNRNPDNAPLYADGRVITGLCTATNFLGEPVYLDEREFVIDRDMKTRKTWYYDPYHQALQAELDRKVRKFGKVLLVDCHSIRRFVPAIRPDRFPDLILGTADSCSASGEVIRSAVETLGAGSYSLRHNDPFKGGTITRMYGRPEVNVHALQLEMSKDLYMDDAELVYDRRRAETIQRLLITFLQKALNEIP